jgi:hypothetical protein
MKQTLFWLVVLVAVAVWIADLHRRLQAAEMRGDMYRDISARLDRRLAELTEQATSES